MYRYICSKCRAHLDPGEKCDCQDVLNESKRAYENLFATECDGQMVLMEVREQCLNLGMKCGR